MAQAIREDGLSPASELRDRLTACEKLVVNLRGKGAGALDLLHDMDRVAALWPELEAAGMDLRPEAGRWETLQADLRRRAPAFLAELRSVGGLPAARSKQYGAAVDAPNVEAAHWWWYLAEETRAQNVRRTVRAVGGITGAAALITIVVVVLNWLFPVDPKVQEAYSRLTSGQLRTERDADLQGALADFQRAAELTPDDPDPWLWAGATHQKLGDFAAASADYDKARSLVNSELDFRAARIPVYASLAMLAEAQADADAALAIDPESPQIYYYLATVYEQQGRLQDASVALQRASEYATARDQSELTAMARYRLAVMMQQVQMGSTRPTPTP